MTSSKLSRLSAIVFDWAGTTVDYGSRAPALAFQELFKLHGVDISAAEARGPMGMAKRDHIAALAAMPSVARAWQAAHGRPCGEADIDALYAEFLPVQARILTEHSELIAGLAKAVEACREMGLKIGSSTGYSRQLMEIVSSAANRQGYEPACVVCADDVPHGRPAPDLLYEAARRLNAEPLSTVIAVDDTPVGIEAGRNAGCWAVGVTRTGNLVGLSPAEFDSLPEPEARGRCDEAAARLRASGAHYTVESAADILPIIHDIESRLQRGELPSSWKPEE